MDAPAARFPGDHLLGAAFDAAQGANFLDAWERVVDRAKAGAAERTYSPYDMTTSEGKALLHTVTDERPVDFDERRFVAPTSMRDVEPETHIWLRLAQLDEGH